MAVLRKHKVSNYTVIDNNIFKNRDLSLKAKGLLCLMLSLPDDWDYTLAGLATLSSDGIDSTRSALNELEEHKYFKRNILKENGRYSDVEYIVSETPMADEEPILEEPILGKPILGNQLQLNTYEIKEKKNKVNSIIEEYNRICSSLPRCIKITPKRESKILARLKEYTIEDFITVFHKAEESDFLGGRIGRWKACLDWFIENDENMTKVIEGRYDNRSDGIKEAYMELEGEKDDEERDGYDF